MTKEMDLGPRNAALSYTLLRVALGLNICMHGLHLSDWHSIGGVSLQAKVTQSAQVGGILQKSCDAQKLLFPGGLLPEQRNISRIPTS